MVNMRLEGLNHVYFDKDVSDYSNVALGFIIRALSHSLKVAYVDVQNKSSKFTNFLENVSLSYNFVKYFNKLNLETFVFKPNLVSRAILPQVEFNSISYDMFWDMINDFDLIIFENVSLDLITRYKIQNILSNKLLNSDIVFTFSKEKDFWEIYSLFDIVSTFKYDENSLFLSNKNITTIYGNGKGKSLYALGHMLRNFIIKEDVKFISFDKGEDYFGANLFFVALKNWSKTSNLYGTFDFVFTGLNRNFSSDLRTQNINGDYREAKEGLMLLKTSLKKHASVVADELINAVKSNLIDIREVLSVLNSTENELLLTGSTLALKQINEVSSRLIEVKGIKNHKKALKKGIDY